MISAPGDRRAGWRAARLGSRVRLSRRGRARSRLQAWSRPAPDGFGKALGGAPGAGGRAAARALPGPAVGRGRRRRGVSEAWRRRRRCCSSSPPPQAPSPPPSAHARTRSGEKRWWLSAPAAAAGGPPRRRVPAARSSSRTGSPDEPVICTCH